MKIFASAIEGAQICKAEFTGKEKSQLEKTIAYQLVQKGIKMHYNLMSYYYIRDKKDIAEFVRDNSELVVIDSGAHSFQFGKTVDWVEYTKKYAEFIKRYDRPNVLGYFEMDVDNVIGYKKVLELRKILEEVSDKIIPVWHKNRGLKDFDEMCKKYAGKVISITGFSNADIRDDQYIMFVKHAKKYNCKVFCLGMTRKKILDKVPFDYVDSSSWSATALHGMVGKKKVTMNESRTRRGKVLIASYLNNMKKQEYYHKKWRLICKD